MIFQILLIAFALFALQRTYRQYRARRVTLSWFAGWFLLWIAVIVVALAPQTTDVVARYVGVEKGADLLVYSAVVILYYALYRVMVRQEKLHREMTGLVRKLAILEAKKGTERKQK